MCGIAGIFHRNRRPVDADVLVRRQAVAVTGTFAYAPARATLVTILGSDADALARRNAAWALGKIGDAASRPALEAAATSDASSLVRSVARAAISSLR